MWELDYKESWVPKNLFWTVVLEKTLESPLDCKEIQPVHPKGEQSWIFIGIFWISNTLVSWCKELTHLKRPWCCERLKAGGEGDDRGWDGWMGSPTQWTWVWVNSGSWWWTGRPGVLQSMGSQRVGHDWATELNLFPCIYLCKSCFFSRQFPFLTPACQSCCYYSRFFPNATSSLKTVPVTLCFSFPSFNCVWTVFEVYYQSLQIYPKAEYSATNPLMSVMKFQLLSRVDHVCVNFLLPSLAKIT